MPLEVRPLDEVDVPTFYRIQVAAFKSGITEYLTPVPVTEEYRQHSIEKHLKSLRNGPGVYYLKVVDTDLDNQIIAGAKWLINEKERTEEELQAILPVPGEREEGRPAAQDFMRYLARVRKLYVGTKPWSFLNILVTDPEHQRRGAGSMLVKWGTQKADEAGLPCFLEASEAGKLLYLKNGFEVVHEEVFDLTKYGGKGNDSNSCMVRKR